MLRLSSLVVSWWLVGASFAQEPAVAPAAEPKLVHLRVIGASVSGGFKDGPLDPLFRDWRGGSDSKPQSPQESDAIVYHHSNEPHSFSKREPS